MHKEIYIYIRKKYSPIMNKGLKVKEESVKYNITEEMLCDLWYKNNFNRKNLITITGEPLILISTGEFNTSSVPDFVNAKIVVSGKELSGDVEIHTKRSDWFKHKHENNPEYKNVILHVFYDYDTQKTIGQNIYELCIKDKLPTEFFNITEFDNRGVDSARYSGACGKSLEPKDYKYLEDLIISAAELRLNIKSEQFFHWLTNKIKEEQLLYESICEVFGYMNNRDNFLLLSHLVPIKKLRKIVKQYPVNKQKKVVETIYFGISGLLSSGKENQLPEYYSDLKLLWDTELKKYFGRTIDTSRWRYYKERPVNYPQRRISALSRFMFQFINTEMTKLFLSLISIDDEKEIVNHLTKIIYQPAEGYFSKKCNFSGRELRSEYPLFGISKVVTMIVNIILPYFIYKSKSKKSDILYEKIIKLYKMLEFNEENRIVNKFIEKIIFYPEYRKYFKSKVIFSQGLIQLYKDFCEPNKCVCSSCKLPEVLKFRIDKDVSELQFIEL